MKEKSCGAVIYNNGMFLIVEGDDCYGFPKGHIEEGESEEETAKREIKEETNLEVNIDTNFRKTTNYVTYCNKKLCNVDKEVVYFLATNPKGNVKRQEEEIKSIGWYSYDEALGLLTYEDTKKILKEAYMYIKNKN